MKGADVADEVLVSAAKIGDVRPTMAKPISRCVFILIKFCVKDVVAGNGIIWVAVFFQETA